MNIDWKKDIKMNELVKDWDKKKELIILVLANYGILFFLGNQLDYIWNIKIYVIGTYVLKFILVIPGIIYFIKHKKSFKELFLIKNPWEIIIGIFIAFFITAVLGTVSAITGNAGYMHFNVNPFHRMRSFFYYIFLTGFREEFTYRVVIEESVENNLKNKKAAPLITAVIFAFSHIILGTELQVVISFFTGLIFGYTLYFIKKCSYISVSIGHGLYDFMVVLFGIRF